MADQDDLLQHEKIPLSPVHKTDGGQGHPHLEDNFDLRDGRTAYPDSISAHRDEQHFLEGQHPKIPVEELPEILQQVPIPQSTDPAITTLLAAINQTNTLIL